MKKQIPNLLSTIRILCGVIIIPLPYLDYWVTGIVIFLLALISDWFDGFLAALFDAKTDLGRILDKTGDGVVSVGSGLSLVLAEMMSLKLALIWIFLTGIVKFFQLGYAGKKLEEFGEGFSFFFYVSSISLIGIFFGVHFFGFETSAWIVVLVILLAATITLKVKKGKLEYYIICMKRGLDWV